MLGSRRGPILMTVVGVLLAACAGTPWPFDGPAATTAASATATPSPSPDVSLGTTGRPIVIALPPSRDGTGALAAGEAMAEALASATSLSWEVRVPASYAEAVEDMCAARIDLAWLSPLGMALASRMNCGDVLLGTLRRDETGTPRTTYGTQILVRSDSGIADIGGLRGRAFVFAGQHSLAGRLFPAMAIEEQGGEPPSTFFSSVLVVESEREAVLALYEGRVAGAATSIDAREELKPERPDVLERTKRIWTGGPIPNDVIGVRSGVPATVRDRVRDALLEHSRSEAGKRFHEHFGTLGFDLVDRAILESVLVRAHTAALDLEEELRRTPRPETTGR